MFDLRSSFALATLLLAACTGSTGGGDTGVAGNSDLTGTYGTADILPIEAAYWIGSPGNAGESNGGPFIYLFGGPVSCNDLSQGAGWLDSLPADTQVLEMIVGSTTTGSEVPVGDPGSDGVEINYNVAGQDNETTADSGGVTLTTYTADTEVDGTVDATFAEGSASGTFQAVYCATGNEL
jgi:hypothetical protein